MRGKVMSFEHIGVAGKKWGVAEIAKWRSERVMQRSYTKEVVEVIDSVRTSHANVFDVLEYGKLSYQECGVEHPLFAMKTKDWRDEKPSVFVTGGVHGYETSGYVRPTPLYSSAFT